MNNEARNVRNLASIIMAIAGSKEKVESVWPLKGDKKHTVDTMILTKEMYENIKKAHNLN